MEQIPLTTWDPANPRYFSGTGCEARGIAVPISGYVSHAQLCINDTVVQEYWDTAAAGKPSPLPTDGSVVTGTNQTSATVKALFDSTHFADSNPITIKLKVTDTNGGYYEATVVGPAYNMAFVLTNHTLGFYLLTYAVESQKIESIYRSINYSVEADSYDDYQTILGNIPEFTTFLITSHANDGGFGDCYDNSHGHLIYYSDVAGAVNKKTMFQAPYNFAFIDGCHSAGHPNEELLDGPQSFGILPSGPQQKSNYSSNDRAFVGFTNFVWSSVNIPWLFSIYQDLAKGYNLYDSVVQSSTDFMPEGSSESQEYLPVSIDAAIMGDPYMTLHGVYKGTMPLGSNGSSQWFRALP